MEFTDEQLKLKDDFIKKRGYWNDFWDGLLKVDADFFNAYLNFSAIPSKDAVASSKIKKSFSKYKALAIATLCL